MTRHRPTADQVAARKAEAAAQRQAELFDSRLTTDAGIPLDLFATPATSWADEAPGPLMADTVAHKIRWLVYSVPNDRSTLMPRQASMRGLWTFEAVCSCGQETRTGGATERHIRELIWLHKFGAAVHGWHPVPQPSTVGA